MTIRDLDTHDIRDQFAAYVDPRFKEDREYNEHGEDFDAWLEKVKAESRGEGYTAGRIAGIADASEAIIAELDSTVERAVVVGSEARAYKAGVTIAKSVVERIAKRLALTAKNRQ
jgi:type IV secretory pathway VirJ component